MSSRRTSPSKSHRVLKSSAPLKHVNWDSQSGDAGGQSGGEFKPEKAETAEQIIISNYKTEEPGFFNIKECTRLCVKYLEKQKGYNK